MIYVVVKASSVLSLSALCNSKGYYKWDEFSGKGDVLVGGNLGKKTDKIPEHKPFLTFLHHI